jgi:hypothetical protein
LTSDFDLCKYLKEAIKEEVKASEEYEAAEVKVKGAPYRPFLEEHEISNLMFLLGNILAPDERSHAERLTEAKIQICPGEDPDLSDASEYMRGLSEKAKAKMKEIWEAAKKRAKYEAELTMACRLDASREGKRAYDEALRKCAIEKRIAPPP